MEEKYKVSVIVPIYNVEKYIERCAQSLLEQTLDNVEYIFVNDDTPDNSIEKLQNVINKYPLRKDSCVIFHHEKNKGLPAARNTGLTIAKGEYILHCDSDDYMELNMLESLYNKAKVNSLDVVYCDFYMDFNSKVVRCNAVEFCANKIDFLRKYITFGWNVVWNTLVKRELYVNNSLYSYENYNFCEDYGLMSRVMYYANSYYHVQEPLYHYNRTNVNSIVNTQLNKEKRNINAMSEISVNSLIINFFKEKGLYNDLEQELSWRILHAKTFLLSSYRNRKKYLSIFPESDKYVDSNPLCSKMDKYLQKLVRSVYTSWLLDLIYIIKNIRGCALRKIN